MALPGRIDAGRGMIGFEVIPCGTPIFLILLLSTGPAGEAGEWNQWRGPLRNGVVAVRPALADAWD